MRRRAGPAREDRRTTDALPVIVRRAIGRRDLKTDRTGMAIIAAAMPMPLMIAAIVATGSNTTLVPVRQPTRIKAPIVSVAIPDRADAKEVASRYSRAEMRCLARAVYHEANFEPVEGQIAVAEVIIARSQDKRWKGDLCHTIRMRNQFSFVKGGRTLPIPDATIAQRMMDLVRDVAAGRIASRAKGALYYHADYVSPSWRHNLAQKIRIKTHIFYTDPVALT